MIEDEDSGVRLYLSYEDSRYPVLVLQYNGQSAGYSINKNTLEIERICICNAREDFECCCGFTYDEY